MNNPTPRRCPYSGAGLGAEVLRSCAGFREAHVSFEGIDVPGGYPGKPMPSGITCFHLGHTGSPRGWRSECRHPQGLPSLWAVDSSSTVAADR